MDIICLTTEDKLRVAFGLQDKVTDSLILLSRALAREGKDQLSDITHSINVAALLVQRILLETLQDQQPAETQPAAVTRANLEAVYDQVEDIANDLAAYRTACVVVGDADGAKVAREILSSASKALESIDSLLNK